MADDMILKNILGDDYQKSPKNNAVYLNGKLRYFNIDIDQPGKYFFDLSDAFNASVDEGNKVIPIRLNRGGDDINLNGYTVSADGQYPDHLTPFHVGSSIVTANPSYIRFNLPLGLFQAVGVYHFQFTFKNETTGEILKSPWQFFNVTQSATNMALDLSNGIEPFDSEYTAWKQKVEQQVSSLSSSVETFQSTVDTYTKTVNTAVDNAWNNKLNSENTWTAAQHFRGITADTVGANNLNGTNLNIDTSANLPTNTTVNADALKNVGNKLSRGLFVLEAEYNASTVSSENQNGASFLNGVTTGTASNHYMSFRVFRCEVSDGSTRTLMEIRSNCSFPSDINGKPVVQFPTDSTMWDGVDQTPFVLGKWIVMFEKSTHTLKVLSKVNASDNDQLCLDARMI